MSVIMDITTANPAYVTVVAEEGRVSLTYDAYVKSNVARSSGKWYVEFEVLSGNVNVGFVRESYSSPTKRVGTYVANNHDRPTILTTNTGYLYDGKGSVTSTGALNYYNTALPLGTIIGLFLDLDNRRYKFSRNGVFGDELDIVHDEPMCICLTGISSSGVNASITSVNLGSREFSKVPKDIPYDTKSFDDTRYARENVALPFLEKESKKYVVKKGIVELNPPIRSVHSLDNMVNVEASSQFTSATDLGWDYVYTPFNVLNQYSNHKHDVWIASNGVRSGDITIDYGRVNPMSGVRMTPRNLNNTSAGQGAMPTNFDILGSVDGKAWTNIHKIRNSTGWSYNTVRDFMFSETFFYRYLKLEFNSTQNANALYASIGTVTVLVDEMVLVEFDKTELRHLVEIGLEELNGLADQITENRILISSREFNNNGEKSLTGFKGARTIKITGGEKVWEL